METTAADFNSVSGFMSLIFYIETILAYQQRQANKFLCLPIIFFLQYNIPVSRTMRTKLFTQIFHSHSDIHLFIYFVSHKSTISDLKYNMKSTVGNFELVSLKTKEKSILLHIIALSFYFQILYNTSVILSEKWIAQMQRHYLSKCYCKWWNVWGTYKKQIFENPFHSSMNFSRIKLLWCVFLCKKHETFC